MALYRLNKLSPVADEWPCQPKNMALHLLRLVTRKPWSRHADRLLRLFWVFIRSNEEGMSAEEIEAVLMIEDADNVYQRIFQLIHPDSRYYDDSTLQKYLKINQMLIQNFWNECFLKAKSFAPIKSFAVETLFWADMHSDVWLHQEMPKTQLFIKDSPWFEKQYQRCFYGSREQIW